MALGRVMARTESIGTLEAMAPSKIRTDRPHRTKARIVYITKRGEGCASSSRDLIAIQFLFAWKSRFLVHTSQRRKSPRDSKRVLECCGRFFPSAHPGKPISGERECKIAKRRCNKYDTGYKLDKTSPFKRMKQAACQVLMLFDIERVEFKNSDGSLPHICSFDCIIPHILMLGYKYTS